MPDKIVDEIAVVQGPTRRISPFIQSNALFILCSNFHDTRFLSDSSCMQLQRSPCENFLLCTVMHYCCVGISLFGCLNKNCCHSEQLGRPPHYCTVKLLRVLREE